MLSLKYGIQNANNDVWAKDRAIIKFFTLAVEKAITLKNKNPTPPNIFNTICKYSFANKTSVPNRCKIIFTINTGYAIEETPATTINLFVSKLL